MRPVFQLEQSSLHIWEAKGYSSSACLQKPNLKTAAEQYLLQEHDYLQVWIIYYLK